MAIPSTNVSADSIRSHYGLSGSVDVSNNRLTQDLAFVPFFSAFPNSPSVGFNGFAGVRGALNHSLGGISLTSSEARSQGSFGSNSAVQYQAQSPSTNSSGDRITCILYDSNDASPGFVGVNSYFTTTSSGSATLQLDWNLSIGVTNGYAVVLVRSYANGYISGPFINNGLYEGTSAIGSLGCSMNTSYPHTIISIGLWGPGDSTSGVSTANIHRARLR